MFDSSEIRFRKLDKDDMQLLHRWLHAPHVHAWYEKDKDNILEEVIEEYSKHITGEEPIQSYIVLYQERPFGYIQSYNVNDWPEFTDEVGPDDQAKGIDVFIGELAFVGKGIGSMMISKFLQEIVFREKGITRCIIDPEPDNKRAIKVYEKVGFTYVKTLQIPGEPAPAYLMDIKKV